MKKTYWQAMDGKNETYLFPLEKPRFNDGMLRCSSGVSYIHFLFPIPLKPLQIATITVNENGTWSWEIEREEGFYMAVSERDTALPLSYKGGSWYYYDGVQVSKPSGFTISPARITDECII